MFEKQARQLTIKKNGYDLHRSQVQHSGWALAANSGGKIWKLGPIYVKNLKFRLHKANQLKITCIEWKHLSSPDNLSYNHEKKTDFVCAVCDTASEVLDID